MELCTKATLRRSHTTGMKSKVHPTYKTKYRVANWPAYNRALVRRGDVTVWVSSEAIAAWTASRSGRRGGQRRYSDLAIETALRRWCADAGRPTRFKPSSPSPTDAVRDGSAKLGHPVQNVTREHGLTPLPR